MRPIGVVSKNDIGAFRILVNIELCNLPEATTILVNAR